MGSAGDGAVEELLITNKSLIVASSWSHLYLLFKDTRSFEYKVCSTLMHVRHLGTSLELLPQ